MDRKLRWKGGIMCLSSLPRGKERKVAVRRGGGQVEEVKFKGEKQATHLL